MQTTLTSEGVICPDTNHGRDVGFHASVGVRRAVIGARAMGLRITLGIWRAKLEVLVNQPGILLYLTVSSAHAPVLLCHILTSATTSLRPHSLFWYGLLVCVCPFAFSDGHS